VDYGVLGTLKDHNTLVLFRSFDRFASYISSSPFWHPQSFRFFGTISIISAVSLHFLFDIKDIIFQCSGELVILILLLTFFYAKKTLNSELLNCELQNVFYLNLAKAVFCLWLKIRRISWLWVNISSFISNMQNTRRSAILEKSSIKYSTPSMWNKFWFAFW